MYSTQISEMSATEKLQLMDAIWEDLSAAPERFEPPIWHSKELEKNKARREMGLEELMTLQEAKQFFSPSR